MIMVIVAVVVVAAIVAIVVQAHGVCGDINAVSEWCFGASIQRVQTWLGVRMHYGHPDFVDLHWARNRGSMSNIGLFSVIFCWLVLLFDGCCCWLLLVVVGCLLVVVGVGCCWLFVGCFLFVVVGCLLVVVGCCCLLFIF